MDLGSTLPSADLVHKDRATDQVSLIDAHAGKLILLMRQIASVTWGERRHFDDHVEARGVNKTPLSVQGHIDCSSELPCVDSENVDLALRAGDQDVVLAGMDVEAGDLAVINEELCQGCLAKSIILDFN